MTEGKSMLAKSALPGEEEIAQALCKRRNTRQCAALCLQHSSLTTDRKCPEALHVFGADAKAILALRGPVSGETPSPLMKAAAEAAKEVDSWSPAKQDYARRVTGSPAPLTGQEQAGAKADQEFVEMLWKWFEDRGCDLGPERRTGLTASDFKDMLDEHERMLAAPQPPKGTGEIDRLADAIWEYGEHRKSCRIASGKECDCGFFDILKSLPTPADAKGTGE